MKTFRTHGFTLIELLVVIAIIMILAAMVFVVGPRIIERAKITSLMNVCNQIKTACVAYSTKDATHGKVTFPPAYGYRAPKAELARQDKDRFFLNPYLKPLEFFRNFDMYDSFARLSHDTDGNGWLSPLEFSPVGKKVGPELYEFPTELYKRFRQNDSIGSTVLQEDYNDQMAAQRPLVYLPVNHDQLIKVQTYWQFRVAATSGRELEGAYAQRWLPDETFSGLPAGLNDNPLASIANKLPPVVLDDFVLISVGPGGSTGGILDVPVQFLNDLQATNIASEHWYYILALRAYFLATRDMSKNEDAVNKENMEGNGMFDFDFRNRTRGIEGKPTSYKVPNMNFLPDGTNGAGPLIYSFAGGGN